MKPIKLFPAVYGVSCFVKKLAEAVRGATGPIKDGEIAVGAAFLQERERKGVLCEVDCSGG
eukprot:11194817-Prorocentrum_lima.AAC.1